MKSLFAVALVSGVALVGCGKKEEAKPAAPPPAPQAPSQAAQPAAPAPAPSQDVLKDAQAQGQAALNDVAAQGRTAVAAATTQGRAAVDSAAAQGQAAANDLTALATQKLDEAVKYIKENKLDAAEKVVNELEGRKATFPAAIQQRVGDVRKLLDTAKAARATGLTLPKF